MAIVGNGDTAADADVVVGVVVAAGVDVIVGVVVVVDVDVAADPELHQNKTSYHLDNGYQWRKFKG